MLNESRCGKHPYIDVSPRLAFQMLLNIFMKILLEMSNVGVGSAFHLISSDSCSIAIMINFFFRVSYYLSQNGRSVFWADDYSVH